MDTLLLRGKFCQETKWVGLEARERETIIYWHCWILEIRQAHSHNSSGLILTLTLGQDIIISIAQRLSEVK